MTEFLYPADAMRAKIEGKLNCGNCIEPPATGNWCVHTKLWPKESICAHFKYANHQQPLPEEPPCQS